MAALNIANRLDILNKLEAGINIKDLAREYNVTDRTIRRIRQTASSIRQFAADDDSKQERKRIRSSASEDIDNELYSWCLQRRLIGDRITDQILIEKAKAIQQERGGPFNFTPSKGWVWRFKKNYNLHIVNTYNESDDADKFAAKEFVRKLAKILEEEEIIDDNLYNMDETSLFWKMLPTETLISKNEKGVHLKKFKKDRITLALCSNASGNHKLPLLLINRYENPRALKHCKNNLPVIYTHHTNAWMDTTIFQWWYHNEFKPRVRRHQVEENINGKVLLILDNFNAHKLSEEEMNDDHFKVIFLPINTSSLIQPMDQGVISKFKSKFRHKLLQCISQFDNEIAEFYADYDIKDCIDLINESWSTITAVNIFNSWKKILNRDIQSRNLTHSETAPVTISNAQISDEEITEWINQCGNAEQILENATEENLQLYTAEPENSIIEAEEIDRLMHYLQKISITETEIAHHAKCIVDYYNSK